MEECCVLVLATTLRKRAKLGRVGRASFSLPLAATFLSLNIATSSEMSPSAPKYPMEEASSYGESLSGCIVTHSTS